MNGRRWKILLHVLEKLLAAIHVTMELQKYRLYLSERELILKLRYKKFIFLIYILSFT